MRVYGGLCVPGVVGAGTAQWWGIRFLDDTGYRRLEDGAALPRPAVRATPRHWLPGVALAVALLVSLVVWAGIILAVVRFWHRW
jgi:hypothetical protein